MKQEPQVLRPTARWSALVSLDLDAHRYAPQGWAEVVRLVHEHPLAWVVSSTEVAGATPLPLRPRLDDQGRIVRLDGHFARTNRQVQALREGGNPALILFMGVNGYVSPSWMADRTQAPTWIYASVAFQARLALFDDGARIAESLDDLTGGHEAGREKAWATDEMGGRFERLARGVVGFQAEVLDVRARFKLGQDEREDVFEDIVRGLRNDGRPDLAATLRRPES